MNQEEGLVMLWPFYRMKMRLAQSKGCSMFCLIGLCHICDFSFSFFPYKMKQLNQHPPSEMIGYFLPGVVFLLLGRTPSHCSLK